MNRRTFLKQSTALGTGLTILKSGILKAGNSPNEKLNIAIIGVAGRGGSKPKESTGRPPGPDPEPYNRRLN